SDVLLPSPPYTAHSGGKIEAHHPQLAHLLDGLFGEVFFGVHLLCQGLDFILSELAVHLLRHELLLGQSKIHQCFLPRSEIVWSWGPAAGAKPLPAEPTPCGERPSAPSRPLMADYSLSTGVLVRSAL